MQKKEKRKVAHGISHRLFCSKVFAPSEKKIFLIPSVEMLCLMRGSITLKGFFFATKLSEIKKNNMANLAHLPGTLNYSINSICYCVRNASV